MENTVNASTAGSSGQILVAGAGYAGLHVALRLTAKLRSNPKMELTLVNRRPATTAASRSTGTCASWTARRSTSPATLPRW